MDRFIAENLSEFSISSFYLKSNMDRFIGIRFVLVSFFVCNLKSNMDRFIVVVFLILISRKVIFKIQYG